MKKHANSYKKVFGATLAVAVATGTIAVAAPVYTQADEVKIPSFSDVKNIESHHFYESVRSLASRGIVKGYPDGTFKPYQSVTRGQIASVLAQSLGLDTKNVKNPGFKDVKVTDPHYGAIAALVEAGIVKGYNDKTFKPGGSLTRAHIAKMISIGFNLEEAKLTNSPFTDVKAKHWYANYVQALITNEITTGTTPTTFEPNAFVTRGQMASLIVRSETATRVDQSDSTVKSTGKLVSVTNESVKLSTGTYALSADMKKLLNASNSAALLGAVLEYTVKNGVIIEIASIELTADGNETNNAILDGQGSTFAGSVRINGDYVLLKNITIAGNLEIGKEVENSFKADDIKVIGKVSLTDNASRNRVGKVFGTATVEKKEPSVVFTNSTIHSVELSKSKKIIIEVKGNSTVQGFNLLSNVHLKADKGITLPKVTVEKGATNVTLDASVVNLLVDTPNALSIDGTATIKNVIVEFKIDLKLLTIGEIEKIIVKLKGTTITLGAKTKVSSFELPTGVTVKDIIVNFNEFNGGSTSNGGNTGGDWDPSPNPNPNPPIGGGGKTFNLSLMHVNDIHANTNKAPKLVTAVKEVRTVKPDALLLNAGDVFSGTLYFNEFLGQADLAFMNLMKVDAMTFGNHEFDLGSSAEGHKALVDFIEAANFPFVSANVDFSKDDKFTNLFNTKIPTTPKNGNIYTGIVKEINGEKVGIFGLTTAETADIASPGKVTFSNYIEDAKKMVAEFEKMGVNKIVALTHIGFDDNAAMDNDQELAANVAGIDVIVGGHSHTQLDVPVVVDKDGNGKAKDKTIIVQAYQYSDYLGTLDVEFDKNGVVVGHAGKLIEINKTQKDAEGKDKKDEKGNVLYVIPDDAEAVKLLKPYKDKIAAVNEKEIGVTLENALVSARTSDKDYVPGTSVRASETILGNLITDGMLAKAQGYVKDKKVIMAFQNGGGIRAGIGAGPITVGEVITVLPFGNTLATMELTGSELKATFEISFKEYPKESGGFLHVSGAKVKYDSSKPAGQRVVSIAYKNDDGTYTEIENAKTYTIATNAFTAKGGDGYDVLKKAYAAGRATDLGLSDWENLREHLVSLGTIPIKIEGRLVDVAGVDEEPGTEDVAGKDFSGTVDAPKIYNGNVTVSVTDVVSFKNVTVKGNLILTGTPTEKVSFANIMVTGNLDISKLDGENFDFNGITVDGETIF
ncbi:S-layer homology domain-containing protein [Sporosarcina sp. E16_8]|uniref:S-layer homology domain-containing protein n=1 Tax=Sporosarcina sp. E16_8 TaxID=2789295 RepID=UPI001A9180E6|nr:S-layer homology domain-containing protein [Sporosarcina sp. E16_8]MBO0588977.1 S-layer homology domain-containing protein [Sporosarcina sp. E16_8]